MPRYTVKGGQCLDHWEDGFLGQNLTQFLATSEHLLLL